MIIVTGATGKLGREIVERLIQRVPAGEIGISVRDPEKARALADRGVRVRRGDFSEPESLQHAFEDGTQLLIVSSNAAAIGGDPRVQHGAAIEAARALGVRRIVYTSHMAASETSAFPPMLDHYATEEMLRTSGLAWTALRNGFYASSAIALMADGLKTGVIEAPADGKVAWTAHADLAEAAVFILTNEGRYDGPTPSLTGSEALDLEDLAAIASHVLGRSVTRRILSDDDGRKQMAQRGLKPRAVEVTMGLYIACRRGEFLSTDPTLERLLGRSAIKMQDVIAE